MGLSAFPDQGGAGAPEAAQATHCGRLPAGERQDTAFGVLREAGGRRGGRSGGVHLAYHVGRGDGIQSHRQHPASEADAGDRQQERPVLAAMPYIRADERSGGFLLRRGPVLCPRLPVQAAVLQRMALVRRRSDYQDRTSLGWDLDVGRGARRAASGRGASR